MGERRISVGKEPERGVEGSAGMCKRVGNSHRVDDDRDEFLCFVGWVRVDLDIDTASSLIFSLVWPQPHTLSQLLATTTYTSGQVDGAHLSRLRKPCFHHIKSEKTFRHTSSLDHSAHRNETSTDRCCPIIKHVQPILSSSTARRSIAADQVSIPDDRLSFASISV